MLDKLILLTVRYKLNVLNPYNTVFRLPTGIHSIFERYFSLTELKLITSLFPVVFSEWYQKPIVSCLYTETKYVY
jgi:hypothetical protein